MFGVRQVPIYRDQGPGPIRSLTSGKHFSATLVVDLRPGNLAHGSPDMRVSVNLLTLGNRRSTRQPSENRPGSCEPSHCETAKSEMRPTTGNHLRSVGCQFLAWH